MSEKYKHAQSRISFLKDKGTLNDLFDLFERDGMPMGSDRWAEYVITRWQEMKEKERTLHKILMAKVEMDNAVKRCGSDGYRRFRNKMTTDFQDRQRRDQEGEA